MAPAVLPSPLMSSVASQAPVPRRRRRRRTKLQRRQTRIGWLLLIPALAVVAFVAIYPLGKTVYQSFTNQEFLAGLEPTKWVGLQNYRDLWHDTIFRDSVWLTIKFTLITVSRSEEHTSELQSLRHLVCRLLLEKKKKKDNI